MSQAPPTTINAVDRALDVLLLLFRQGREMRLQEIADALKIYKSTIFRTLVTLENKGFIMQDAETKKYALGHKIYAMGILAGNSMPLKQLARPHAERLCQEFNEAVNLYIVDASERSTLRFVIMHREDRINQVLTASSHSLTNCECYCSAAGKCFMAFHPDLDRLLDTLSLVRRTVNTIVDRACLRQTLTAVRDNGFALDEEELEIGLMCVAVPIMGKDGLPVAAMSFSGPVQRIQARRDIMIDRLREAAAEIGAQLA